MSQSIFNIREIKIKDLAIYDTNLKFWIFVWENIETWLFMIFFPKECLKFIIEWLW